MTGGVDLREHMTPDPRRIAVVGTTGSGKTALGGWLSRSCGAATAPETSSESAAKRRIGHPYGVAR